MRGKEQVKLSGRENIKQVVTVAASEVLGYVERKKGNDWYDEECQIKVEERNKAGDKMLNRKTTLKIEN